MARHMGCFLAGPPFVSRQKSGSGLTFWRVKSWPNLICEACTIRSAVDRKLTGPSGWKLRSCFEGMGILDMAHCWALGAHVKHSRASSMSFPGLKGTLMLIVALFNQRLFFGPLQELTLD